MCIREWFVQLCPLDSKLGWSLWIFLFSVYTLSYTVILLNTSLCPNKEHNSARGHLSLQVYLGQCFKKNNLNLIRSKCIVSFFISIFIVCCSYQNKLLVTIYFLWLYNYLRLFVEHLRAHLTNWQHNKKFGYGYSLHNVQLKLQYYSYKADVNRFAWEMVKLT